MVSVAVVAPVSAVTAQASVPDAAWRQSMGPPARAMPAAAGEFERTSTSPECGASVSFVALPSPDPL